jgi:hypothetical protein
MLHDFKIESMQGMSQGKANLLLLGDVLQVELATGVKNAYPLRDIFRLEVDGHEVRKTLIPKKVKDLLAQCQYPSYSGSYPHERGKHTVCVRWFGGCEEICQAFSEVTVIASTNAFRVHDNTRIDNSFIYDDILEISIDGNFIDAPDGKYTYEMLAPIVASLV